LATIKSSSVSISLDGGSMTRQTTNKILEMVEEGLLDRDTVIVACLKYMSEDDVADMARANEFFTEEDDEDNDE
jgi:hypothetical protein